MRKTEPLLPILLLSAGTFFLTLFVLSPLSHCDRNAKNLVAFVKDAYDRMYLAFEESVTIIDKVPLPTDSSQLTKNLVKDLVVHYGDDAKDRPGASIAKIFALLDKADVMNLNHSVSHEILQYIARIFGSNQYLQSNIKHYKTLGLLAPDFREDMLFFTAKSSLSSLRW